MYEPPKPGTILPAVSNFHDDGSERIPNPGPTRNPGVFQRWLQAATQDSAFESNKVRATNYVNQFWNSWYVNYHIGRAVGPTGVTGDPEAVPLQPPAALVVVVTPQGVFDVQASGKPEVMGRDDNGEMVVTEFATGPYIPVCAVPEYEKRLR
jgi:hypothetical protein